MIDYKKIFKIALFFLLFILILYFLFFKLKFLNFKQYTNSNKNMLDINITGKKLKDVEIFYGDPQTDKLKLYSTQIYETENLISQIKQILNLLFEKVPQNYIRVIPEGTSIREVFIDANSILYIDLSEEFMLNNKGGTTFEYLSVYSILKSIFLNFKDIRGIKLLINGVEQETVSGHLSIGEIFRPADINL